MLRFFGDRKRNETTRPIVAPAPRLEFYASFLGSDPFIKWIMPFVDLQTAARLSATAPEFYAYYKPRLDHAKFRHHVIYSICDVITAMTMQNPRLLTHYGVFVDHVGRVFTSLSPFQYAMWALDQRMVEAMLRGILLSRLTTQHLVKNLVTQSNILRKVGVSYRFKHAPDIVVTEMNYKLSALINCMAEYVYHYPQLSNEERKTFTCQRIGALQRLLPAHIVREYTDPQPGLNAGFSGFNKPVSGGNFVIKHRNKLYSWFPGSVSHPSIGLGVNVAVCRAARNVIRIPFFNSAILVLDTFAWATTSAPRESIMGDRVMLNNLHEIRFHQIRELRYELKNLLKHFKQQQALSPGLMRIKQQPHNRPRPS